MGLQRRQRRNGILCSLGRGNPEHPCLSCARVASDRNALIISRIAYAACPVPVRRDIEINEPTPNLSLRAQRSNPGAASRGLWVASSQELLAMTGGDDLRRHRSVNFSSIRRLRARASSSVPLSIGWNSPKPAAARKCGSTPFETRYCTTAMARAEESSQFDLKAPVVIAFESVWPSIRKIQGMSGGISRSRSSTAEARLSSDWCPAPLRSALPDSNRTEDSNTKRSPTTRISGREPRICLKRPKKSER